MAKITPIEPGNKLHPQKDDYTPRLDLIPHTIMMPAKTVEYKSLINEIVKEPDKLSTLEKAWLIITNAPMLINMVFKIYTLIRSLKMANNIDKKTNYAAIVAAVLGLLWVVLNLFGVDIPDDMKVMLQESIIGIISIVLAFIAYFTGKKDKEE